MGNTAPTPAVRKQHPHVKPSEAKKDSRVYVVTLTEGQPTSLHTETVTDVHRAALRLPGGLYATLDGYRLGGHEPTNQHNKVVDPDEAERIMRNLASQHNRPLRAVRRAAQEPSRERAGHLHAAA